ncbi:hypothetical protein G0U57_009714, partial [Chelydra serpentina]
KRVSRGPLFPTPRVLLTRVGCCGVAGPGAAAAAAMAQVL